MSGKIEMVGNWKKEMETSLTDALSATYEIAGRSLAAACKHAIILMAQSAAALTPQAAKNRKFKVDEEGRKYLERKPWKLWNRIYKWQMEKFFGSWERAKLIPSRGLAKRSWMWGLRGLDLPRATTTSKPIAGVAEMRKYMTQNEGGYILTNRLNYLLKILPDNWEQIVQQKVANKIMRQAQIRLSREWQAEMRRKRRAGMAIGKGIGQYFLRG